MRKILLVNVDSTIPNLALEKLRVYYERKGDKVTKVKDESARILPFIDGYDKIYVSCVFDYNKHFCKKWEGIANIGGSGYSLKKCLPDKIEQIKPKMNFGFTTRGCIRNCYFCIVPEKEGKIHVVGDIYDLWDGKSKTIIIMDNNILAAPKHFFKIAEQLKKEKLVVDFNQGLDHRLLTDKICQELLSLRLITRYTANYRFAFDDILYKKSVLKALGMLKRHGLKDWGSRWYVYVGTYDTKETVLKRINILRDAKQLVFVMRDRKVQDNPEFARIYSWSSNVRGYITVPYFEYSKIKNVEDNRQTLFENKRSKK